MSKYQGAHMMFPRAKYSVLIPYSNESIQVRDTYTKYSNDAYMHTRFKNHIACYMVAQTPSMSSLSRSFSAKEPYRQWLFCEKRHAT